MAVALYEQLFRTKRSSPPERDRQAREVERIATAATIESSSSATRRCIGFTLPRECSIRTPQFEDMALIRDWAATCV